MGKSILVAGVTGNLGERIVKALLKIGAEVRFVVRSNSDINKINMLEKLGAKVFRIKIWNIEEVSTSCQGVSCVVSALAGLRDVVIDAQKVLLDSAMAAGVPCFLKIAGEQISPRENELYPAWQGMQYMCNMIDERSKTDILDNNRYPEMAWTTVRELLITHVQYK